MNTNKKYLCLSVIGVLAVSVLISVLAPQAAHASMLTKAPNNLGLVLYAPMNDGTSTKVYPVSASNGAGDFSGRGNTA